MLVIVGALVLSYLVGAAWMLVFPWQDANKEKLHIGCLTSMGIGWMILMAAFMVLTFLPLSRGVTLDVLVYWVPRLAAAMALLALVILRGHVIDSIRYSIGQLRLEFREQPIHSLGLTVLGVGSLVASAMVLRPNVADHTPEQVLAMMRTGALYVMNPYQLQPVEPILVNHSPLYVLYAVGAKLAGMDGVVFVQHWLPLLLLPGIYGIYRLAAALTFGERARQNVMLLFVYALLYLQLFGNAGLTDGLLTNPWNGKVVLLLWVVPCAYAWALSWIRGAKCQLIPMGLVLLFAGQLAYAKGFAPVMVAIGCGVLLYFVARRAYDA